MRARAAMRGESKAQRFITGVPEEASGFPLPLATAHPRHICS